MSFCDDVQDRPRPLSHWTKRPTQRVGTLDGLVAALRAVEAARDRPAVWYGPDRATHSLYIERIVKRAHR